MFPLDWGMLRYDTALLRETFSNVDIVPFAHLIFITTLCIIPECLNFLCQLSSDHLLVILAVQL